MQLLYCLKPVKLLPAKISPKDHVLEEEENYCIDCSILRTEFLHSFGCRMGVLVRVEGERRVEVAWLKLY